MAEGREVVTVLTTPQFARLTRAVSAKSRGQVSLPAGEIDRSEAIGLWRDVVAAFGEGAGIMLTPRELGHLRRRAWAVSSGHAALGENALSRNAGLAFWRLACRLGRLAQRRKANGFARAAGVAAMGLAATQLAACTSLFGGNIKGSFACSAPNGTCAPSTVIDDQALSVIQNARPMTPGHYPSGPTMRQSSAARAPTAAMIPAGSGRIAPARDGMVHRERRVLKVVFPSFVDGGGNLHEPRIIHAVVDDGAWIQLSSGEPTAVDQIEGRSASIASAASTPPALVINSGQSELLTTSSTANEAASVPPGPPSAEAIAAARAKGAALKSGSAIDAIRAEVQGRLAQTTRRPTGASAASPSSTPATTTSAAHHTAPTAAAPSAQAAAVPANAPAAFPGKVEE